MTNEQINVAIGKWEGPIPRFFAGRLYVEDDVQGGTGDTPDDPPEPVGGFHFLGLLRNGPRRAEDHPLSTRRGGQRMSRIRKPKASPPKFGRQTCC